MTWSDTDEYRFTHLGTIETHFKDSWRIGLGMEYIMNEKLSIFIPFISSKRIKYYDPSADKKYLYAGTSEIDLYTLTAGVAYKISHSIEMDIAGLYNYGFKEHESQEYKAEHFFITMGARFRY